MSPEPEETVVFAWLSGQHDNVGDSMLRRGYARALHACGRLDAWVGDPRSTYAAGLGLPHGSMRPGFFRWASRFVGASWKGSAVFAFNAGEFVPTKRYVAGVLLLLPFIAVHRARGGRILWLGAGLRQERRWLMWPFILIARWSEQVRFRDRESVRFVGLGGTMPDWAFALERGGSWPTEHQLGDSELETPRRDRIAVVLRGDRAHAAEAWVQAVRALARRLGVRIVVVVQVERDGATSEALAHRLGAELISWDAKVDHRHQEHLAREEYCRSHIVISDRLHALIMGATEGAVALGWCESATDKISRHFDLIGASWVGVPKAGSIEALHELDAGDVARMQLQTASAVRRARSEVLGVAELIARGGPR